ncbi:MAG: hypothetical protein WC789_08700 [Lentisphaeria bacterium]|jgi:hypothetical protein
MAPPGSRGISPDPDPGSAAATTGEKPDTPSAVRRRSRPSQYRNCHGARLFVRQNPACDNPAARHRSSTPRQCSAFAVVRSLK